MYNHAVVHDLYLDGEYDNLCSRDGGSGDIGSEAVGALPD